MIATTNRIEDAAAKGKFTVVKLEYKIVLLHDSSSINS